jgi:hypothetical protein
MTPASVLFLSGMLTMGFLVISAFFLRFWRQTRDRFFISFAIAFAILAVQRVLLVKEFGLMENRAGAYSLRLLAFVVIVYAVVMKNRERTQ